MFSWNITKKLKNMNPAEIVKIEYIYTWVRKATYSESIFSTFSATCTIRSLRNRLYDTLKFAQQLGFNKFTFFMMDSKGPSDSAFGTDKTICEKTSISEFEVTYYRPDMHRVISPIGKSVITLIFIPCILMFIYFFVVGFPLFFRDFSNVSSLTEKRLIAFILIIIIFVLIFIICLMLTFMVVDYLRHIFGIRRERKNFNTTQLLPKDYPMIVMTDRFLTYERHGDFQKLSWDDISALEHRWGFSRIYDNNGLIYPIPTYELLGVISNDILISNIIECAKLVKDSRRENFWINAHTNK